MNKEILLQHIRPVTEEDRKVLPVFSHSKLEQFENCPFAYDCKYNRKLKTDDTTISLQSGSLAHLILELKGRALAAGNTVDYDYLNSVLLKGYDEVNEKTKQHIPGLNELKAQYWETWSEVDSEGRTYDEKWRIFDAVLHNEMEDDDGWEPWLFEHPFEFVWDNKVIIIGFIDRIDKRGDEFRIIDYKSSKKVFADNKLPTSQQFGIYQLEMLNEFGKTATECLYRFVFIDDTQKALTLGWEKRFEKKMLGIFEKVNKCEEEKIWTPKPSPLCHWCNYSKTNPEAEKYKNECEYYSLWTPTDRKNFSVNKKFDPDEIKNPKPVRKLIF